MKRAVAYIRVSTKSKAQLHSFDYQLEYWQDYITENPDMELVGIYSDWGISGKSLSRRPQLLKLIDDAKKKEFDLVLVKSVARFGRNTTEILQLVRMLRDIGIEVIFENEQISSFDPSADIQITIAAAIAENDLKIYSENQRWSIRERMQQGYIMIGQGLIGYRLDKNTNTLTIVEEEAKIIRHIFDLYLAGKGIGLIYRQLIDEEIVSPKTKKPFSLHSIKYILRNEKYKGCNLSQKTITVDGNRTINKGEAKKYYSENTHPAIINPEIFDKVQEILKDRNPKIKTENFGQKNLYPFSKKLICAQCGHFYSHKFNNTNKPWRTAIWICTNKSTYSSNACSNHNIKDEVLKEKFVEAYNEFVTTKPKSTEEKNLRQEQQSLLNEENELKALKVNHLITIEDYSQTLDEIKKKLDVINSQLTNYNVMKYKKEDLVTIDKFDENKVDIFINKIIIDKNQLTFHFVNGVEIVKNYSNGPSGNQKGWKERRLENGTR